MSKQVLIMRHAKSSWDEPSMRDYDRPLNRRGLRVTPQIAQFVDENGIWPDLIVSSTANRAQTTAELFIQSCPSNRSTELEFNRDFYLAAADVYTDFLLEMHRDEVNRLMLVGHNPGLEELVESLSGSYESMPTAAIAHFDLQVDSWMELNSELPASLFDVYRPKELDIR